MFTIINESPGASLHWSELRDIQEFDQTIVNRSVEHLRHLGLVDLVDGNFTALAFEEVDQTTINIDELKQRQKNDEIRLSMVSDYASEGICRRQKLIEYFDQEFGGLCSGCDVCNRMF